MTATLSHSRYGADMVALCRLYKNRYIEFMKSQLLQFQQKSEDLLNQMIDEIESQEMSNHVHSVKSLTTGVLIAPIHKSNNVNLNRSFKRTVDFSIKEKKATQSVNVPTPPTPSPVADSPSYLTTDLVSNMSTVQGSVNRQELGLPSILPDSWAWKNGGESGVGSVAAINDAGSGVSSNDARSRPSESTVEVANFDDDFIKQELESWSETDPCVSANTAAAAALFAESFDNSIPAMPFADHAGGDLQSSVFDDDVTNSVEMEIEVEDEMEEMARVKPAPPKTIQIQLQKESLPRLQPIWRQQSQEDIDLQTDPSKNQIVSLQPHPPPLSLPPIKEEERQKFQLHSQHLRHVVVRGNQHLAQAHNVYDFKLQDVNCSISSRPQLTYNCSRCHKPFRTSAQRDVHFRIHTGERPFICSECSKSFRSSQSLAAHRLIHREERPYKCESCGRAFRQSSNLASHRLIHSGIRPHKCDVCGKGFIKSSDLRRHSKVHDR